MLVLSLEKPLFAINSGECIDSWIYKVLRINISLVLSPEQNIYTTPLRLRKHQGIKRGKNQKRRDGKCCLKGMTQSLQT